MEITSVPHFAERSAATMRLWQKGRCKPRDTTVYPSSTLNPVSGREMRR